MAELPIIRKAGVEDIKTLLRFEQGVISAERLFDSTLKDEMINYYDLHALIQSEEAELVVAEVEGKIIASGYAKILQSKPWLKHERHAHLGFMYVEPAYRGRGINAMIIDWLKKWAVSKGIDELRLEVYSGNISAIKAYEKVGFSSNLIEMRMSTKEF